MKYFGLILFIVFIEVVENSADNTKKFDGSNVYTYLNSIPDQNLQYGNIDETSPALLSKNIVLRNSKYQNQNDVVNNTKKQFYKRPYDVSDIRNVPQYGFGPYFWNLIFSSIVDFFVNGTFSLGIRFLMYILTLLKNLAFHPISTIYSPIRFVINTITGIVQFGIKSVVMIQEIVVNFCKTVIYLIKLPYIIINWFINTTISTISWLDYLIFKLFDLIKLLYTILTYITSPAHYVVMICSLIISIITLIMTIGLQCSCFFFKAFTGISR